MTVRAGRGDGDDVECGRLLAAQAGDEHAFRELVELHRADVLAHCYRMLGALYDAEDAYQDTMLRAWRALEGFDRRSRFSTWLYRIATNVCLTALQRRTAARTLPAELVDVDSAEEIGPQSRWLGPFPDRVHDVPAGRSDPSAAFEWREAIELAFVAALQLLPPRQRAVLILREVVGLDATEIAGALDTTVAAVNSALQRARARLDAQRPRRSQQAAAGRLGQDGLVALVDRFVTAMQDGDVAALVAVLAADVVFEMPPRTQTARGRDAVARSWLVPTRRPTGLRAFATSANAQPAVAVYHQERPGSPFLPIALDVLEIDGDAISRITAFRFPQAYEALGLPGTLDPTTDSAEET